jgi:hypothetical protein
MNAPPAAGKKLDCTTSSMVPVHVNDLFPLLTDLRRWPGWLRDGKGRGLAGLEQVRLGGGRVDKWQPQLGDRYLLRFTNGMAGEFEVNYWQAPAQISLRLVPETRRDFQGLQHVIVDLDFFPRGAATQLWFGMLLLLEPKFKPGVFARWPAREVQGWVDGFHRRVGAEAPALARQPAAGARAVAADAAR